MARLYCKHHGKSSSIKPYNLHAYEPWNQLTATEVTNNIITLAKKGVAPSKIGLLLRDVHGVGKVSNLTGNKIATILKMHGLAPEIPEDLNALVKKGEKVRMHLKVFKNDKHAKHRKNLNDSKMARLARYYKRRSYISQDWNACHDDDKKRRRRK